MAVHMLRLKCQRPQNSTIDQLRQAVDNWLGKHADTLPEQRQPVMLRNTAEDQSGTDYCAADYRFEWDAESKTQLFDTVENVLQQYCSWWRIKYHVCDHDAQERAGCSWDDVREYGPVPSDLD